jgi:hydroxymethylglutaryl-CoA reductase
MKMHLMNILNHLEATEKEVKEAIIYFADKIVSFTAVREFLQLLRTAPNGMQLPTPILLYNEKSMVK